MASTSAVEEDDTDDGTVRERLVGGFFDKPVLGVFMLILLTLAAGFLIAGLLVVF